MTELSPSSRRPQLMEREAPLGSSGLISAALRQPQTKERETCLKSILVQFFSVAHMTKIAIN